MKLKIVRSDSKIFLIRLTFYQKQGSIKLHLLLNDDKEEPHTHPWNFKSFLLLGAYKEWVDGEMFNHKPFSLIRRECNQKHRITLYRFLGIKLPCITIGKYSDKIQLCSMCQTLGYCKYSKPPVDE